MPVSGFLSSRLTLVLSACVFGASVIALPDGQSGSFAGNFVHPFFGNSCHIPRVGHFVRATGSGFQFSDANWSNTSNDDFAIGLDVLHRCSGFWALTTATTRSQILMYPINANFTITPQIETAARSAYVDYLVSQNLFGQSNSAQLRVSDVYETQTLPNGIVHNLISLLSVGILAGCLKLQRPWQWLTRRPIPGCCHKCKYDLTSLPNSARCPECGTQSTSIDAPANNAT